MARTQARRSRARARCLRAWRALARPAAAPRGARAARSTTPARGVHRHQRAGEARADREAALEVDRDESERAEDEHAFGEPGGEQDAQPALREQPGMRLKLSRSHRDPRRGCARAGFSARARSRSAMSRSNAEAPRRSRASRNARRAIRRPRCRTRRRPSGRRGSARAAAGAARTRRCRRSRRARAG